MPSLRADILQLTRRNDLHRQRENFPQFVLAAFPGDLPSPELTGRFGGFGAVLAESPASRNRQLPFGLCVSRDLKIWE